MNLFDLTVNQPKIVEMDGHRQQACRIVKGEVESARFSPVVRQAWHPL